MPGMTGIDLGTRILKLRPGLPVLLMTGFGGTLTPAAVKEMGMVDLILKPLNYRALAALIRTVTAEPAGNTVPNP
jgi:FixJ family two-component response regulator